VEVRFDEETVWLTLDQISVLFERNKSTISRHIKNVFNDGKLVESATVAKFATVQIEGARQIERKIDYFNLDMMYDQLKSADTVCTFSLSLTNSANFHKTAN